MMEYQNPRVLYESTFYMSTRSSVRAHGLRAFYLPVSSLSLPPPSLFENYCGADTAASTCDAKDDAYLSAADNSGVFGCATGLSDLTSSTV